MEAKLICYTLGKISASARTQFKRELTGYVDHSNKGKYNYKRGGLLDQFPNIKPIRSVIIVKPEDEKKVVKFLKKFDSEYYVYDVILKNKDLKRLVKDN